jgi:hypothetical protein
MAHKTVSFTPTPKQEKEKEKKMKNGVVETKHIPAWASPRPQSKTGLWRRLGCLQRVVVSCPTLKVTIRSPTPRYKAFQNR